MRKLNTNPNVITSDSNYPNGRIRNNTGTGNGTPVNESVYGDIHVNRDKLMDLYGITANALPDNEANGYQIIESMRALASKNDFIQPLSLNTGVLSIPLKLSFMLENESVICKAGFNLASETQIKGSDNVTFPFSANGSFKTNEYVRLVKNASSITIVRIADEISLDDMLQTLVYLKKASQSEENAGVIDTKGTTPLTNKTAFIRRVNGADSAVYLATASQNGIYPKEHFAIIASLMPRNRGWISGLDVGSTSGSLTVSGDINSAVATASNPDSFILVTMANAMDNTNYKVVTHIESLGTLNNDNDISREVFKPVSTTQFQIGISEISSTIQSLKIHIEVIQL